MTWHRSWPVWGPGPGLWTPRAQEGGWSCPAVPSALWRTVLATAWTWEQVLMPPKRPWGGWPAPQHRPTAIGSQSGFALQRPGPPSVFPPGDAAGCPEAGLRGCWPLAFSSGTAPSPLPPRSPPRSSQSLVPSQGLAEVCPSGNLVGPGQGPGNGHPSRRQGAKLRGRPHFSPGKRLGAGVLR